MKKLLLALPIMLLVAAGCSPVEETKNTINYVNEATEYANEAAAFAEDLPAKAQEAVTNPETVEQLESTLTDFEKQISEFNQVEVPQVMEDLHGQISEQNEKIQTQIEEYTKAIEDGTFQPEFLQNSELLNSLQDIQNIYENIQKLGNE
ncbi:MULTISPECIES: DUF6376 family protein [Bacillaceae]|uniref:DUF6376 family protein n=1 Tax=Bacillaceae TaxID=186817 RepID=UPI001E4E1A50|nr:MULTISPECIES: DUF6376 family protein [Bacillaceae]MCE4051129.1 DUF6376 family protein [Bacillus sp. Au-Bac7]MDL0436853.1 DUF6376 family protein [Niallia sp. SS-2023]UPO88238.1 DUF6376 family protein [Niallia sp. Man26]